MNQGVRNQPTSRRKHRWLARLGILLLAIIAVLAALPFITQSVETLAMNDAAREDTDGAYVALSNGIVHYEASGPEGAPAVILIHGISNPYHVWDANFPAVADAGYRVIRYDLYGRGYSDRPKGLRYDIGLFDRQLLELIGKLRVKMPLTLCGFSLGGAISVIFAERHPEFVNGLILVSPAGLPQPQTPSTGLFNLLRLPGVGEYLIRLLGGKMSDPAGQGSDLYDQALLPGYIERLKGLERYKGTLSAWLSTIRHFPIQGLDSSYRAVGDSRIPVLCIWGKEDLVLPFAMSEKIGAAMPQAELRAIEQAGHASLYEKPAVVNEAILSFLRRIMPID